MVIKEGGVSTQVELSGVCVRMTDLGHWQLLQQACMRLQKFAEIYVKLHEFDYVPPEELSSSCMPSQHFDNCCHH